MAARAKTGISWGDLNAALNGLVKTRVILGYSTGMERNSDAPSIEVEIEPGAGEGRLEIEIEECSFRLSDAPRTASSQARVSLLPAGTRTVRRTGATHPASRRSGAGYCETIAGPT